MNFYKIEKILKNNNCNFIHFNSTTSTMEEAKQYLKKFQSDVVVTADEQTNGKGRRGNKWISPPGNIYCSIALNNKVSVKDYFIFNMITLISIKLTLENFGINKINFKWPNDIFFKNKKFGGMILETFNSIKNNNFVIIGIGINYSSSPRIKNYNTTYLQSFIEIKNKFIFLDNFFKNFFFFWNNYIEKWEDIVSKYKKSLMFLNEKIVIDMNNNKNIKGIFKGINYDGSLILYKDDKLISIYSGSIKI